MTIDNFVSMVCIYLVYDKVANMDGTETAGDKLWWGFLFFLSIFSLFY